MSELDHRAVWDALWAAGHGDCGGWSHDHATGVTACACGTRLPATPEAARFKVGYPAAVVAWKSVGTALAASAADLERLKDWQAVGDLLAYIDGHGDHDGWTFDKVTQVMSCKRCGPMYQVGDPLPAAEAVAS